MTAAGSYAAMKENRLETILRTASQPTSIQKKRRAQCEARQQCPLTSEKWTTPIRIRANKKWHGEKTQPPQGSEQETRVVALENANGSIPPSEKHTKRISAFNVSQQNVPVALKLWEGNATTNFEHRKNTFETLIENVSGLAR